MTDSIRVLIVDDHAIVRKGIRALLATEPQIQVVGEAQDGLEAVISTEQLCPDIILMDLVMPGGDGMAAIEYITAQHPRSHVLVLTSFAADDTVFPALRAGALGYLLKDSSPEDLIQAIREVHCGRSSLHPAIARRLLQELAFPPDAQGGAGSLTERETEVLQLVARGDSNRDIADHLAITEATVRTHVSSILHKLGLCSRTQAALYAIREGWASLHETSDHAAEEGIQHSS